MTRFSYNRSITGTRIEANEVPVQLWAEETIDDGIENKMTNIGYKETIDGELHGSAKILSLPYLFGLEFLKILVGAFAFILALQCNELIKYYINDEENVGQRLGTIFLLLTIVIILSAFLQNLKKSEKSILNSFKKTGTRLDRMGSRISPTDQDFF